MQAKFNLFATAFLQVFFVTIATFCIANKIYFGALIASFCINWLWSANVKKAAFGGLSDRVVYALGATSGTASGLLLTNLFI